MRRLSKAERARAAAQLVDETLRREASEGVDDRAELLKPALEQVPLCEAARWQSGFIYDVKRKEWLLLDEVQQLAAKDDRLAAYRKIRAKYPETEGGQTELGAGVRSTIWKTRRRAHWTKVLSLAPDQPEARRELGFQMVNGTWLSQQEIADARVQVDNIQAALHRWTPKLRKLLKRWEGSNRRACELARQELMAIKDPDVVPAIEAVFCTEGGETALLGIELLKNIKAAEAAGALAWQAVFSPWEPIRSAAAAALKEQRRHDYVPPLLAAMRAPIQAHYELYDSPSGGFLIAARCIKRGRNNANWRCWMLLVRASFCPRGKAWGPGVSGRTPPSGNRLLGCVRRTSNVN